MWCLTILLNGPLADVFCVYKGVMEDVSSLKTVEL